LLAIFDVKRRMNRLTVRGQLLPTARRSFKCGRKYRSRISDHTELLHHPKIVSNRPVLGNLAVAKPEHVGEFDRDPPTYRGVDATKRRCLPRAFATAVHDDEIAIANDVPLDPSLVWLGAARGPNDRLDVLDPALSIGHCSVIHHIFRTELGRDTDVPRPTTSSRNRRTTALFCSISTPSPPSDSGITTIRSRRRCNHADAPTPVRPHHAPNAHNCACLEPNERQAAVPDSAYWAVGPVGFASV
jgi:hypothetical protein